MMSECGKMCLMPKKKELRTTVTLTCKAKMLLLKHRNAFSQKNQLSVGMELFDELSDSEKIRRCSVAEAEDQSGVSLQDLLRMSAWVTWMSPDFRQSLLRMIQESLLPKAGQDTDASARRSTRKGKRTPQGGAAGESIPG